MGAKGPDCDRVLRSHLCDGRGDAPAYDTTGLGRAQERRDPARPRGLLLQALAIEREALTGTGIASPGDRQLL